MTSITTSTVPAANRTALDITSLQLLTTAFPANFLWICFGAPGCVGNMLLFVAIVKSKTLRSNFYLCLMHLAIADAFFCMTCTVIGTIRVTLDLANEPQTNTPLNCFPQLFLLYIFQNGSPAQTVCIAVDRLACVAFPARYLKFEIRHLQLINIVMWVVPTAILCYASAAYITVQPLVPTCQIGQVWSATWNLIESSLGTTLDVLTIVIYLILLIFLIGRIQMAKRKGRNVQELKNTLQYRAVITGFMLFGVYTLVALTGQMYLLGTSTLDATTKARLQPYTNVILLFGSDAALVVCVTRNEDIRKEIRSLICPKACGSKVAPANSSRIDGRRTTVTKVAIAAQPQLD